MARITEYRRMLSDKRNTLALYHEEFMSRSSETMACGREERAQREVDVERDSDCLAPPVPGDWLKARSDAIPIGPDRSCEAESSGIGFKR
jgi:hypothetical protein